MQRGLPLAAHLAGTDGSAASDLEDSQVGQQELPSLGIQYEFNKNSLGIH